MKSFIDQLSEVGTQADISRKGRTIYQRHCMDNHGDLLTVCYFNFKIFYIRSRSGPIGSNQTQLIISGYTFAMTQTCVKLQRMTLERGGVVFNEH
jgi:hypothetical protein